MGADGCSVDRKTADNIVEFNANNVRIYKGLLQKYFGKKSIKRNEEFAAELEKEDYDAHKFMSEKEYDVRVIKRYGKKATREALADKLMLIIETYPAISDMMHKYLLTRIPEGVYLGKKLGENVRKDIDKEDFTLNLDRFPESTLRIALGNALNLVNMTTQAGYVRAKIGDRTALFKTPKKLKWLDPSGAFEAIAAGVRDHAGKISSRINLFMESPQFIPKKLVDPELRKKAKRGMASILEDVDALDDISPAEEQSPDNPGRFQALFAATMKGWVFIKNGKFFINQTYEPRREFEDPNNPGVWVDIIKGETKIPKNSKTRKKRYESTGDTMFSFQDPISLKNYQFPMEKDSLHISMNESQVKSFQKYLEEARDVTNLVFDYIAGNGLDPKDKNYRPGQMKESTDSLLQGLIDHYDGKLDEFAVRQIFFYGKTEWKDFETGEVIDLLENLSDAEKAEIELVKHSMSTSVTDDLVIMNGGSVSPDEVEFRKNYWPTIYNFDVFRQMIQGMLKDFTIGRDKTAAQIRKIKISKQGDWINILMKLEKQYKHLDAKIESAEIILNNMDDYHMDNNTGNIMHFSADNKHFKRISNAYDIRSSRLDKGVFYDYLKKMMGAVEKNNLNLTLLQVLKRLKAERSLKKPRISPMEEKAIIEAAVNYHGTTYSSLKMTGILGDMESFTRRVKWWRFLNPFNIIGTASDFYKKWKYGDDYNIHISPEMQSRYLKTSLSTLSGLFLQSFGSVITNTTGAHQNIIRKGWKATHNAYKVMTNKKYREGVKRIVQQSGITEFSDFFSKAMINGILEMQLEGQIADGMLAEMILYHNRIGTWEVDTDGDITGTKGKRFKHNKETSRKVFNKAVVDYLSQSDLWLSAEKLEIRSRGRVLAQQKEARSRMKLYAANKLIQFAINNEYAMKPALKNPTFKQWAKYYATLPLGKAALGTAQIFQYFENDRIPLTMAKGEALIRTLSFVLGAELAWKSGSPGLRNDIHWSEYQDEEAIDKIIQIGREYSYEINFGMSIQDVAQFQFGPAQVLGKFKYWNQQKAEADIDILKEAFMYFEKLDEEKLLEPGNLEGIQIKGVAQGIKKMMKLFAYTINPVSGLRVDRLARQELAAYRYMVISNGLTSFLYQTFLLNPITFPVTWGKGAKTAYTGIRAFGWKTGLSHQLRNFAVTDVMKMITFLPAMGARKWIFGQFMDDDEFEDKEEFWAHFLQMFPFAGYGITWTYDTAIMFISLMMDEEEMFVEKASRSLSVKTGNPQLGPPGIAPMGARQVSKLREGIARSFYDFHEDD